MFDTRIASNSTLVKTLNVYNFLKKQYNGVHEIAIDFLEVLAIKKFLTVLISFFSLLYYENLMLKKTREISL